MKNNKILIIVLAIVLVVSVGVGSYFIFDSIYTKEHETNNDLNNQTGNNNVNNETNNNNGVAKTSLEILNDLVNRGYLKESNLTSKEDYESFISINDKGQIILRDLDEFDMPINLNPSNEIKGKVSKVDLLICGGAVCGFLVITEDGKLYSQNNNYIGELKSSRQFEEIALPSRIKKIYEGKVYSVKYYVLLENNEVYELIEGDGTSTDIKLGDKLSNDAYIEKLEVSSLPCGDLCYPILKFTYDGKTYFDNEKSIYEIKGENNNSISAKYAIASHKTYEDNDNITGNSYQYVDAYIVDLNNNIYVISKISEYNDGEHKINTNIKKHSSKKVKTVSNDSDDNQVIVTYVDGFKETIDGYYISMNK